MSLLRTLYEQALAIPLADRDNWLRDHCQDSNLRAQLAALLQAERDDATGPLDRPAADRLTAFEESGTNASMHWTGRKVGAFRLRSLIGQGGMAVVFLAEREDADFEQQVAVKLLLRGLVSEFEQHMFRRERQALASLSHPNIARLIDGGIADSGVPYLAMEFVEGVTITAYCTEHRLDLPARLELFVKVCHAVDAAHRALIVHRDIKPSNILVTGNGTVKLLDFGVAKLLQSEDQAPTRTGLTVLTPEYAAPEQFDGGGITTATDVYALGVLLHEMLLGVRPQREGAEPPSSRAKRLVDLPPLPMTAQALRRRLKGDLDNITMKALEPEPLRRYASAGAMADDIERHLQGQPVVAHPPSAWYRTRKFIRRHRGGVAATVLLLIGILASLAAALWQARIAVMQARRADQVSGFLVDLFESTVPAQPAEHMPSTGELLEQGVREIESRRDLDQQTRLRLMSVLAVVSRHLGLDADAERLATLVVDQTDNDEQALAGDRAAAMLVLSALASDRGASQHAAEFAEQALLTSQNLPALKVEAMYHRATLRFNLGETEAGIALLRESVTYAESVLDSGHEQTIEARKKLAFAVEASGESKEAESLLKRSLSDVESHYGPEHAKMANVLTRYALFEAKHDRFDSAETLARRAVDIDRKIYQRPHRRLLEDLGWLGDVLRRADRTDENLKVATEAEALARALLPPSSPSLPSYINNLGVSKLEAEVPGFGETELRDSLELLLKAFGADDARTLATQHSLARSWILQGRAEAALPLLDAVLERKRAVLGLTHVSVLRSEIARADALLSLRRFDEANVSLASQSLAAQQLKPFPAREWGRLALLRIEALSALGHDADARSVLAELHDISALAREDRCRMQLWRADFAILDRRHDDAETALALSGPLCGLPSTRARQAETTRRLRQIDQPRKTGAAGRS